MRQQRQSVGSASIRFARVCSYACIIGALIAPLWSGAEFIGALGTDRGLADGVIGDGRILAGNTTAERHAGC